MKRMMLKRYTLTTLLFFPLVNVSASHVVGDTIRLNLDKALEIALSENPTIKVADQEIEKKKYARKGSYAALFPQVNFTMDYSRTLKKQVMYMDMDLDDMGDNLPPGMDVSAMDKGFEVGRNNNWNTGFSAAMPLVNVSLWKSLSISGDEVDLAVEKARSSRIAMRNEVKKSFYGALLAQDSYEVFKRSYDNAVENYQDIKQKFDQGLVAEYDLIRADVMVKNTEPNMLQAENSCSLSLWRLKALMGMELDLPISCVGKLTDYKNELFADYVSTDTLLARNTELKQLALQKEQLHKTLQMRKFDYLPTLSLTGLYQWNSMNNDFKFHDYRWNPYSVIGLSVKIPIMSGGDKFYKVRQARITLDQLSLQRDDTKRNLQLVVKQHMDNMKTCVKQFDAAQKGVEQAEKGYLIAQKRYDTGAGTLLELNDAELALTQARLNFNQSIYDYMVSKSELEKVLGNGVNEAAE